MNCEEADRLLDAYLDRELELRRQIEMERHLSHCPACQALARNCQELRTFVLNNATRYRAPAQLRAKILAMAPVEQPKPAFRFWREPWVYAAIAILVLSLSLTIFFPDNGKEFSSLAVLEHSRSLVDHHLVDVASADQRVLKPWLAAKLDFSPPVADLPSSGFSLVGGRVDYLRHRAVAAVVYRHKDDVLTLFCWPGNRDLVSTGDYVIKGYRVCTWSNAECNYIAVAKLGREELAQFADSFRDHVQSNPY
jgi:anti-sigma factor RsiW